MRKNNIGITQVEEFVYKAVKQPYTCEGQIFDKNELDSFNYAENNSFFTKEKKEKMIQTNNKTICLISHKINGKTMTFKGTAICNRKDDFNEVKGKKIAYLRAKIAAYEAELVELMK